MDSWLRWKQKSKKCLLPMKLKEERQVQKIIEKNYHYLSETKFNGGMQKADASRLKIGIKE